MRRAEEELQGHVVRCSDQRDLAGGGFSQAGSDAEVENLELCILKHIAVGRFDVAVDDAFSMRIVQCVADLPDETDPGDERHPCECGQDFV